MALSVIWAYRWFVRPFLRRQCLFEPSCSEYALRTFRCVGFRAGVSLVRQRLHACRWPESVGWTIADDGKPQLLWFRSSNTDVDAPPAIAATAHERLRALGFLPASGRRE